MDVVDGKLIIKKTRKKKFARRNPLKSIVKLFRGHHNDNSYMLVDSTQNFNLADEALLHRRCRELNTPNLADEAVLRQWESKTPNLTDEVSLQQWCRGSKTPTLVADASFQQRDQKSKITIQDTVVHTTVSQTVIENITEHTMVPYPILTSSPIINPITNPITSSPITSSSITNPITIPKYKPIHNIGKGAFGSVMLVHDIYGNAMVMKTIPEDQWNIAEIRCLRLLDHPNILKIYDYYIDNNNHHLITEHIHGKDLYGFIDEYGILPERMAHDIFYQLVPAIKYAHSIGIVHGDLKLENIFIELSTFRAVLGDWGLSTCCNTFKCRRILMGTPQYLAPEMIVQDDLHLDYRKCDIWALGVILYIMVNGSYPFGDHIDNTMYDNIVDYKYIISPHVTHELKQLLRNILCPHPTRISLDNILSNIWHNKILSTTK